MVLDLPRVADADAVSEFDLFERFAIDSVLSSSVPGPRDLVFIKDTELHLFISYATPRAFPEVIDNSAVHNRRGIFQKLERPKRHNRILDQQAWPRNTVGRPSGLRG